MKKVMLSQPMAGRTDEEIITTRENAIKVLEKKGYEIVNTLFTDEWYGQEKMEERGVVQVLSGKVFGKYESLSCGVFL